MILEIIKVVGGIAGLIALSWRLFEMRRRFVTLKLKISYNNNIITAHTALINKGFVKKRISYALLIIQPEESTLGNIFNAINNDENNFEDIGIASVSDLVTIPAQRKYYFNNQFAIIPLKYYFDALENIHIADEQITYRCSIDQASFTPGTYSVRFYVFSPNRYYRSTQDLLVVH